MKRVDFRTSFYFPGVVMATGAIFFVVGIVLLFVKPIAGTVLTVLGLLILSTHYRLRVDFDKKTFQEYLFVAGFKSGEIERFETIEYLYLTKGTVSQTMHSQISSATFRKEVYNSYLKFSEGQKIHLFEADSKDSLLEKLKMISSKLNVEVIDHS